MYLVFAIGVYACSVVLAAWGLWYLAVTRRIPAMVVLLYLVIITHVRPLILLFGLDDPLVYGSLELALPDMIKAQLCIILWIFIYIIATTFFYQAAPFFYPILPKIGERESLFATGAIALGLVLLGAAVTLMLVSQWGGVSNFVHAVKIEKSLSGSYAMRQISVIGGIVALYGLLLSVLRRRSGRASSFWTFAFVAMLLVGLASNFVWGDRTNIALVLITAVVSWHFLVSPIKLRSAVAIASVGAVGLFILGLVRRELVLAALDSPVGGGDSGFWRQISMSLHFVEFDALVLAVGDVGEEFAFRGGQDFLNGLVSWVPRFLWENKPDTFYVGPWFRQIYEPWTVNGWPMTPIGSWYVNFWVPGIFIGAILTGVLAESIRRRYLRIGISAWDTVVALSLALFFMDGGINTGFPQFVFLFAVPLYAVALLSRSVLGVNRWSQKNA